MRLFVMRHGQTNNNLKRLMTGRFNEDINEAGILQAKEATEEVKKIDYDVILSSPLLRARHTADIVNVKNLPVITDDRLQERDMGFMTNAKIHSEVNRDDFWSLKPDIDYRDAEPLIDMYNRAKDFYEDIKKKYSGKTVLAVTHDGFVRVLHGYLYGAGKDGTLLEGTIKNCELREITEPLKKETY